MGFWAYEETESKDLTSSSKEAAVQQLFVLYLASRIARVKAPIM